MKKDNKLVIAVVLAAVLLAGAAMNIQADSHSAKTAAGYNMTQILSSDGTTDSLMFEPVTIHTSEKKDLVISVSAITNIVTDTRLKGEFGEEDSVIITVSPKVYNVKTNDYSTVYPGEVTFASRIQKIEGRIVDTYLQCDLDTEGNPTACYYVETPLWLNLTLDTTNANAFNFLSPNVGSGDHVITVNVSITASSFSEGPDGDVPQELPNKIKGIVGPRTLVVNEVRLAQAYAEDGDILL